RARRKSSSRGRAPREQARSSVGARAPAIAENVQGGGDKNDCAFRDVDEKKRRAAEPQRRIEQNEEKDARGRPRNFAAAAKQAGAADHRRSNNVEQHV